MTVKSIENNQPLAVCLHASSCSSRQWGTLAATLEARIRTITPDLVGHGRGDKFRRGNRLSLDHEVQNVLRQIKVVTGKDNGPLHLVGHAYGAAVALQIALQYPERVASLTLYEPTEFLLLFNEGLKSTEGREILALRSILQGPAKTPVGRWNAARKFIDYWSGDGAWNKISFRRQLAHVAHMPAIAAEFEALLSSRKSTADFPGLNVPVRLIVGSKTRATVRKVSELLGKLLPNAELVTAAGADHMAPATDNRINPLFAGHVFATLEQRYAVAA